MLNDTCKDCKHFDSQTSQCSVTGLYHDKDQPACIIGMAFQYKQQAVQFKEKLKAIADKFSPYRCPPGVVCDHEPSKPICDQCWQDWFEL